VNGAEDKCLKGAWNLPFARSVQSIWRTSLRQTHGRQVRQGDPLSNDGRCPVEGEPVHRGPPGQVAPQAPPEWLAAPISDPRHAGFLLAKGPRGGLRGRMLLAWLPPLPPRPQEQSDILGRESGGEQAAR